MNTKTKRERLEALKMLLSSQELGNQRDVIEELKKEGFELTQATLSRDFRQLKVAKATGNDGKYVYVLPNETMYRRVRNGVSPTEMLQSPGYLSIHFTRSLAVIKTRPGYASSIAYNIDQLDSPLFLGTIAGDDTIFVALSNDARKGDVITQLREAIPDIV